MEDQNNVSRTGWINRIGLTEEKSKKHVNELVNLRNWMTGSEDADPDWKPAYMTTIVSLNVAVMAIDMLYRIKAASDWIPIENGLPKIERYPNDSDYILLSFENGGILPAIGRYHKFDDGGRAFYVGDQDEPCSKIGLFVNAWMPLPEAYKEDEHDG